MFTQNLWEDIDSALPNSNATFRSERIDCGTSIHNTDCRAKTPGVIGSGKAQRKVKCTPLGDRGQPGILPCWTVPTRWPSGRSVPTRGEGKHEQGTHRGSSGQWNYFTWNYSGWQRQTNVITSVLRLTRCTAPTVSPTATFGKLRVTVSSVTAASSAAANSQLREGCWRGRCVQGPGRESWKLPLRAAANLKLF